jgi:hypothetical protein
MAETKEDPTDVGAPDISDDDAESSDEDPCPEPKAYKEMFHPTNTAFFLATQSNWWKFCIPIGLYYVL